MIKLELEVKIKANLGHFHPLNPRPLGNLWEDEMSNSAIYEREKNLVGSNFHLMGAKFSHGIGYLLCFEDEPTI